MKKGGIEFKDQSAFDLLFTLVEGAVEKDNLSIIDGRNIVAGGLSIEAAIIGASHMVSYKWDNLVLTEIFACLDPVTVGRKIARIRQGRSNIRFIWSEKARLSYVFTSDISLDGSGKIKLDLLEKKAIASSQGLVYEFPLGALSHAPKTVVFVEKISGNSANIITAHSYPNEGAVVFTETMIVRT